MKFIVILLVLFSSSYAFSGERLIECKRLSANKKDDKDRFNVVPVLNNLIILEDQKEQEKQRLCPLIIKTRDKIASNCDNCYLNLHQYDDKGWFQNFPCKYLGKGIELECKKDE